MKYIQEEKIMQELVIENKYDIKGRKTDGDDWFAKSIVTVKENGTENKSYLIKVYNGGLYDPIGPTKGREKSINLLEKRVKEKVFIDYMSYLGSKNKLFLTRAQRGFIND